MHAVCFQYLRLYTEEVAGRAPVIAAGRKRGFDVIEELGLLGSTVDAETIRSRLDATLGAEGTRLCLVRAVTPLANGGYEVTVSETACTAGQHSDTPMCSYTLGVFIGAIQGLTGKRIKGHELVCEACDENACHYVIEPIEVL
ncbi:MAG: V4R domain-containing protein [Oscillochloridaceae bacterium umkhey_bin13]